jgi:hypothetical protein
MNILVLVLRLLLIGVCCETSIRYALWWRKVRTDAAAGLLPVLMLGIALVQAGTFIRHFNFFHNNIENLPVVDLVILPDAMILAGTIVHLVPCWRISHSFSDQRIAVEIIVRGLIASLIAAYLLAYGLLGS